MGKYKRYKNRVEKFLAGENGKRFFNFSYSIGAAVVILGALFKILHLPGGNFMLSLGMGVEVVMFCLSAFDKPSKEYNWEEVFPVLNSKDPDDRPDFSGNGSGTLVINRGISSDNENEKVYAVSGTAPQPFNMPPALELSDNDRQNLASSIQKLSDAADQLSKMSELTQATQQYFNQLSNIAQQMEQFREVTHSLTTVSNTLLDSYKSITDNSDGVSGHAKGYVSQMESLNRNLSGLNTIYEIQLKSVSSQLDTIDRVNAGLSNMKEMYEHSMTDSFRYRQETEKMTQYMTQLNSVYERMLNAMTVNMANRPGMPGQL